MTTEEKDWIITLKRLAAITGGTVPELLNGYWECETDYVNSIKPFTGNRLDSALIVSTQNSTNQEQKLIN